MAYLYNDNHAGYTIQLYKIEGDVKKEDLERIQEAIWNNGGSHFRIISEDDISEKVLSLEDLIQTMEQGQPYLKGKLRK